ncbi:MAG: hypothetical protein EHJ95_06145 [Methanobacteriota archaeon]|nr:MAG: hypothetical protein EHJ95_06145 [Euryarchaeota archaeon]
MTTEVVKEKAKGFLFASKVKLAGLAATGMGLVASASAAIDINGTIGPVLDSMIELIPTIIALIVAIIPAILIMSVIGFIVAFLDKILSMMKL